MAIPVELHVCTEAEMEKWSKVPCNAIHTVAQKGRLIYAASESEAREAIEIARQVREFVRQRLPAELLK